MSVPNPQGAERLRGPLARQVHLVLGVLRAQREPLTPVQLSEKLWWLDWADFSRTGDGCFNGGWLMQPQGPTLVGLAELRDGQLPAAWGTWLTVGGDGHVTMTEMGQALDLDELSRWTEELVGKTASMAAADIAALKQRLAEQRYEGVPIPLGPIPMPTLFALCGFAETLIPLLVQDYEERRAIERMFASME